METPLAFPALHASHAGIWMGRNDGQVHSISKGEAAGRAAETPMVMLNAPLVAQRLGYPDLSGLDLLELYAFVYPARFAVPTPKGLAKALGLDAPATDQEPRAICCRCWARWIGPSAKARGIRHKP
jgi:ATP-dependent DNA helicase DinG